MTDLWIDVLLALMVTLATVIADWIANRFITSTRRLAAIKQVIDKTISEGTKLDEIKKEIERFYSEKEKSLTWGSDLASIAFSMDLAILGVWVTSPSFFPFFSRWNSNNISREIPIWMILLLTHFLILIASIALKHLHSDAFESTPTPNIARFLRKGWVTQNKYMLASNAFGFISLLSSFVIITNSL
jgi:hypothetical protein